MAGLVQFPINMLLKNCTTNMVINIQLQLCFKKMNMQQVLCCLIYPSIRSNYNPHSPVQKIFLCCVYLEMSNGLAQSVLSNLIDDIMICIANVKMEFAMFYRSKRTNLTRPKCFKSTEHGDCVQQSTCGVAPKFS